MEDWLKFFRKFDIDDARFKSITKTCANRSFIFNQSPNAINKYGFDRIIAESSDNLNISHFVFRDISLRITAIRETFEELGILICKSKDQLKEPSLFSYISKNFDIAFWQKEVKSNCILDFRRNFEWKCAKSETIFFGLFHERFTTMHRISWNNVKNWM